MSTVVERDHTSWLVAVLGVVALSSGAAVLVDALWHWCTVPLSVAGVLIGVDVVDWARGRLETLEPRALVALFGFHLIYLAPVLHLTWDSWPLLVAPAEDWRASLGVLSVVNAMGLVLYRVVLARPVRPPALRRTVDRRRLHTVGTWAALVGLCAFVVLVLQQGGPLGYLSTVVDRDARSALAGRGWLLLLAESWPLVVFALIVVRHRERLRSRPALVVLLLVAFVLTQFLVGGLRGSRANTVWPALMALGIVHLLVLQVRRKALVLGAVALLLFVWIYGLYKAVGVDSFAVVTGEQSAAELAEETGRSIDQVLLGDFGRAGIQAIVVDRTVRGVAGPPALGGTYLGDTEFLLPQLVADHLPPDKVETGTRVVHGPGAVASGYQSTSIYGLVGEAVMNVGLYAAPLVFLPFAVVVRRASRVYASARSGASLGSALVAPGLAAACILALGSDLDNALWFVVKQVLPLVAIVGFASRPVAREEAILDGGHALPPPDELLVAGRMPDQVR